MFSSSTFAPLFCLNEVVDGMATGQQPNSSLAATMQQVDQSSGRNKATASLDPITHTKSPIVTGTSVLGVTYKDGIILAADTLGILLIRSLYSILKFSC
jgi:hypothetical protein